MREVKKKFKAIGYIRHVNLVRVVSFSSDQFDRHGHMPNGYFPKSMRLLPVWRQRKKIIIDIVEGLRLSL